MTNSKWPNNWLQWLNNWLSRLLHLKSSDWSLTIKNFLNSQVIVTVPLCRISTNLFFFQRPFNIWKDERHFAKTGTNLLTDSRSLWLVSHPIHILYVYNFFMYAMSLSSCTCMPCLNYPFIPSISVCPSTDSSSRRLVSGPLHVLHVCLATSSRRLLLANWDLPSMRLDDRGQSGLEFPI